MNALTTTDRIDVAGAPIDCAWFGEPSARAIILLHEGLGSIAMWRDFPARLNEASGWSVFAYSRRGYGQSAPLPAPYEPDYMHREADILPVVLEAVGIMAPVLFGHSDGGSIALIYAARHPDHVQGLILEAPHVFVEALTVRSIAAIRQDYERLRLRERLGRYHDDPDTVFQAWSRIWIDGRFRDWTIEGELAAITAPTLLIQGEEDEYGTLEQLERIRARVPHATTKLLPDCGHSPHRDQPAAVLQASIGFLAQLEPRS